MQAIRRAIPGCPVDIQDDIAQDLVCHLMAGRDGHPTELPTMGFVRQFARWRLLDHLRLEKRNSAKHRLATEKFEQSTAATQETIRFLAEVISIAQANLGQEERKVLDAWLKGADAESIAYILRKDQRTVRSHLRNIRSKISSRLSQEEAVP